MSDTREQHTPGPWLLESNPYEDGMPYFKIMAGEGFYGDGDGTGFGISEIMSEADARLIAAAPELLQALKIILHVAEDDPNIYSNTISLARAAIAKAEDR